jgi:hypothetical protein
MEGRKEGKKEGKKAKGRIFEEIMTVIFPKLMTDSKLHIQSFQRTKLE